MSETATKLLEQLLGLPEAERFQIADHLWDSLSDGARQEVMDDGTSDPEFRAELQRRLDAVADGTAELIDGEEVFRQARERLRKGQQP